jgi:transposase
MKGILNQLFPELENNYDVFGKTIIKLLSIFPSAKSLSGSEENFFKLILGNVSEKNKSIQKLKQIKLLSNNSIGIDNKALELVLLSKIELLLFLKDKVSKLNKLIDDNINPNNKLQSDIEILSSVDGIGDSSAKSFMIEIGNINNFDNSKKLSAFIGIDPSVKQSGTSIDVCGGISKRGNSRLRYIIYHMAIGVSLYNKIFKDYFNKKRLEGKTFKQSIIAVANKLLRTILAMLKNKNRFNYNLYGV